MIEHIRSHYQQVIASVLENVGDSPECSNGDGRRGDVVCDVCEKIWCWDCISYHSATGLTCQGCLAEYWARQKRRQRWKWTRMPAFYVVVVVAFALVLFLMGVGRPDTDAVGRAEEGAPWHRQRVPRLWLQQALRAKERALYLKETEHQGRAEKWAALAVDAVKQVRRAWHKPALQSQLALGQALMTDLAGNPEDAYGQVLRLENELSQVPHARLPYYLHRARLAWNAGYAQEAIEDWTLVLHETTPDALLGGTSRNAIDDVINLLSDGTQAAALELQIRHFAGTTAQGWEARRLALQAVQDYGVADRIPREFMPPEYQHSAESSERSQEESLQIQHFRENDG